MENGHLWLIYPLKMVIFHSYVNIYQRVIYEELTPFFRCWVEQLVSFEHHSTCTNVFFSNNQTSIELRNPTCPLVILIQHSYGPMEHGPFRSKKIHAFNDLPTVFVLAFSIQGCVSPAVIYISWIINPINYTDISIINHS